MIHLSPRHRLFFVVVHGQLFNSEELLMRRDGTLAKDFRVVGTNKVGMLAWHVMMRTPEYPEGREVVVIANDGVLKPVVVSRAGRLFTESIGASFQWYRDGKLIAGETSTLLSVPPSRGVYQVEARSAQCALVSDPFLVTGLPDMGKNGFGLFPNPVVGNDVNIVFQGTHLSATVAWHTMEGKKIMAQHLGAVRAGETRSVSAKGLPAGVYLLALHSQNGQGYLAKVMVAPR